MKRLIILLIALLGCEGLAFSQSLDEYFKIAAENNPGLQAQYKSFEAALQKVPQVSSLPDPNFSFGYFISPVETRVGPQRARFSLSQMFPWFGTLKAQKDVAALMAEARYQDFLEARNKLYYELAAAYYPLYELKGWMEIERENLRILESWKNIATSKFENGKGSMVDVLRTDLMINQANTSLSILEMKKKPLQARFNQLLNLPAGTPVATPDTLAIAASTRDYRRDSIRLANPRLHELDLEIEASEAREEVALKQGMPKIGAGIDYVVVGQRKDASMPDNGKDVLMPMVTVSLPIFRSKYRAAQRESQLMQESLALQKEELTNRLDSKYEMLWFEMEKQVELIALYDQQILESEQSLNLIIQSYANSGKDFEEILRMQQQLLEFEKMRETALASYHVALAELDYITAKTR